MEFEKLFSPLEGFNFELLDDPDFKEDSVREEIISPILRCLGYCASKPNRIIRSKALQHPFVSVGSARKKITCIPDYLLEVNGKYSWVLEAKSPTENILSSPHVEQAYSYAIHSEIRVPLFALCNGKEFVLFHISKQDPILHFNLLALPVYFENLRKHLSPTNASAAEFKLAKDFGLHLKRLGFSSFANIIFPNVPIPFIGQVDDKTYSTSMGIKSEEGDQYVMTLDFGLEILMQFREKVPDKAIDLLLNHQAGINHQVQFVDGVYKVNIDCRVGEKLQENEDEIFLPFIVNRIFDFKNA